jgi:hypothetical protein
MKCKRCEFSITDSLDGEHEMVLFCAFYDMLPEDAIKTCTITEDIALMNQYMGNAPETVAEPVYDDDVPF